MESSDAEMRYKEAQFKKRYYLKMEVMCFYSQHDPPQCANPFGEHQLPYTNLDALTIDHIDDDGAERRAEEGHGYRFYCWLKKHHYPGGYQVLCWNCQWIKRNQGLRANLPNLQL
jgi:hypothetical protein